MTIIMEGPDRIGKSTQSEKLLGVLHSKPVHVIHYSSPKGFKDKKDAKDWLASQYRSMFYILESFHGKADFILDRSHISEMIYAPMYRGYVGDYVLDIEKEVMARNPEFWKSVHLVTFIDKSENLILREDGQSFSSDITKKKEEIAGFIRATKESSILSKSIININGRNSDEVFAEIKTFLNL